ncbi:U3 small nucleolar RNA-associated protein MPP10 [Diplonema papillatum]|nr:U3 small nucleolar RNA-associated protein MPP10 [Diplonema papillatum]
MAPPAGRAMRLQEADRLVQSTLGKPEEFVLASDELKAGLRGAMAALYTAAREGFQAGLPKVYTARAYDADQIWPQLEPFSAAVCDSVRDRLPAWQENAPDLVVDDTAESEDDEGAEESVEDMEEGEELEEFEESDEEGDEDEEGEEDEAEIPASETLAGKLQTRKGSKLAAAAKQLDADAERRVLADIEGAYSKKKKTGKKGKDEEELLLDKLQAEHGGGEDESDEAPIAFGKGASKKKAKAAAGPTDLQPLGDDDYVEGADGGYGDEDMDDDEDEEAALREMYGEGNYDAGEGFGGAEDESDDEAAEREEAKFKRAAGDRDAEYSSDEEEVVIDDDDDEKEEPEDGLTPFQQRQRKLMKKIRTIEDERAGDAHWALKGESMANLRPSNALLDEVLEFDHTQKAKPLITADVTKSLEDRLKRRIQEGMFDDVERKERRTTAMDLTIEHRNEIDLHAKSKVGLADLHEKEWLDKHRKELEDAGQTSKVLTEEEKEELKVIQMWRTLASSLDMLSNFYYTPKPQATDELQVRASQKSAISMEEATPSAVSNTQLLAPQDVAASGKRKYDAVGTDELSVVEKKRLRRAKKEAVKAKEMRKTHQKGQQDNLKQQFAQAKEAKSA